MEMTTIPQILSPAPPPEASSRLAASFGNEVDQLLAATVAEAAGLGAHIDIRA